MRGYFRSEFKISLTPVFPLGCAKIMRTRSAARMSTGHSRHLRLTSRRERGFMAMFILLDALNNNRRRIDADFLVLSRGVS